MTSRKTYLHFNNVANFPTHSILFHDATPQNGNFELLLRIQPHNINGQQPIRLNKIKKIIRNNTQYQTKNGNKRKNIDNNQSNFIHIIKQKYLNHKSIVRLQHLKNFIRNNNKENQPIPMRSNNEIFFSIRALRKNNSRYTEIHMHNFIKCCFSTKILEYSKTNKRRYIINQCSQDPLY